MLPGKFIRVVVCRSSPKELLPQIREGYLKGSWRENDSLRTGYVLVSRGKIVGAIVEDVTKGKILEGDNAFLAISETVKKDKIKAIEIYEANLDEILSEHPNTRVTADVIRQEIPGNDVESLLKLLRGHKGTLRVHNGSTSWDIKVESGNISAVKTIRGQLLRGDVALKKLREEMGAIIREGRYEVVDDGEFTSDDSVRDGKSFIEGIELLNEKIKFERKGA